MPERFGRACGNVWIIYVEFFGETLSLFFVQAAENKREAWRFPENIDEAFNPKTETKSGIVGTMMRSLARTGRFAQRRNSRRTVKDHIIIGLTERQEFLLEQFPRLAFDGLHVEMLISEMIDNLALNHSQVWPARQKRNLELVSGMRRANPRRCESSERV